MVNKSEVTDVVQDVFLSVIRMQDFARIKCPEGHLFRAAINKLRDRVRRERTLGPRADGRNGVVARAMVDPARGSQALKLVIRSLPERTSAIFVMRALEDWRESEVAALLNISSRRAVEKHYSKALLRMRKELRNFGISELPRSAARIPPHILDSAACWITRQKESLNARQGSKLDCWLGQSPVHTNDLVEAASEMPALLMLRSKTLGYSIIGACFD